MTTNFAGRCAPSRRVGKIAGGQPNSLGRQYSCAGGTAHWRFRAVDAYENAAGPIAARLRAIGLSASVGVPIIVDGRVWGVAAVASVEPGPMPADTEVRIGRFAELITTALVAGDRDEQRRQLMAEASRRANLIDAVLEGRAFGGERSGWQVAGHLAAATHRSLCGRCRPDSRDG